MDLREYLRESQQAMDGVMQFEEIIVSMADEIWKKVTQGGTIYWMGNGGSAGDSQHLSTELVGRFSRLRKPIRSQSLTTNTSLITALANDDGYETIFSRQVEAFVTNKDVVIGISTSGASKNILLGLQEAGKRGATVIGFTNNLPNQMGIYCDMIFKAPSNVTGVVQQMHITLGQALCLVLENKIE
jgi:D-sedoheptulose 7-phosphate isomerase